MPQNSSEKQMRDVVGIKERHKHTATRNIYVMKFGDTIKYHLQKQKREIDTG